MVNKTLLDKAGLDIPETIADWEEMLAAFKEMGVRIPFSFGCDNKFAGLYNAFSGAYGVPAGSRFMDENGTAKFGPMQEGYKEFLTLFHKWYQNGWLDPDFCQKSRIKRFATTLTQEKWELVSCISAVSSGCHWYQCSMEKRRWKRFRRLIRY